MPQAGWAPHRAELREGAGQEVHVFEHVVADDEMKMTASTRVPRRRSAGHQRIDVEALEFDDGHFDLIICNHVLEHVDFLARALAEFCRCLRPGGHLIAQTPYSPILRRTIETTTSEPESFATYYYGQNDHARLYGLDLIDEFHAAGLLGEPIEHTTLLGELDAEAYGVNPVESFFLFSKPAG